MIGRPTESVLEQLVPLIDTQQLVIAGATAAALHALTARDTDGQIDLATRTCYDPAATEALGHELHGHLTDLHAALSTLDPHTPADRRIRLHIGDDYAAAIVPAAPTQLPVHPSHHHDGELLTLTIDTVDPAIQPITDPAHPALSPGGMRLPALDQATVARQALTAWLARPHDTHTCADLGLAIHRVGPEMLWTAQTAALVGGVRRYAAILAGEAGSRLADAPIPNRLRARAIVGLDELRHTLKRNHQHPPRR